MYASGLGPLLAFCCLAEASLFLFRETRFFIPFASKLGLVAASGTSFVARVHFHWYRHTRASQHESTLVGFIIADGHASASDA
jgi:hypothetical protein